MNQTLTAAYCPIALRPAIVNKVRAVHHIASQHLITRQWHLNWVLWQMKMAAQGHGTAHVPLIRTFRKKNMLCYVPGVASLPVTAHLVCDNFLFNYSEFQIHEPHYGLKCSTETGVAEYGLHYNFRKFRGREKACLQQNSHNYAPSLCDSHHYCFPCHHRILLPPQGCSLSTIADILLR